jgi:hypothetical protein
MERDRARNPYSIPGSASDEDSTATTMYQGRTATRRPGDNRWTLLISSDQVALPVSCRGLDVVKVGCNFNIFCEHLIVPVFYNHSRASDGAYVIIKRIYLLCGAL